MYRYTYVIIYTHTCILFKVIYIPPPLYLYTHIYRSAIVNAGYRVSQFHKDPMAVKTDAPGQVVWYDICYIVYFYVYNIVICIQEA